ncbi:MAG: glycosyltransferase [Chitinophagaceae bacterium]|nr:MAG: glycosyltransferase [Chitinophagaceae bacterium]
MDKHLHIITLDVPYPVDYGGVFDIFYKLVFLKEAGVKIKLHCFVNKRPPQPILEKYCESVSYYERHTGHKGVSYQLPYIVSSRSSDELVENLLKDNDPILVEGIHCTHFLHDPRFADVKDRKIVLRIPNVESVYYHHLYKTSQLSMKKLYFLAESLLLKKYEASIADKVSLILSMSDHDKEYFRREYKAKNVANLPVFIGYSEMKCPEGIGCFCLYHGNLSVPENEKAAIWLSDHVFNDLNVPFIIAGKDPSERLTKLTHGHRNTCVIANPDEAEMCDLINKAQIHIIPSMNDTGVKLKLVNALFNGRHTVVNDATVKGTGFESACHVAGNASGFKSIVTQLYHRPFTEDEITLRNKLLNNVFDNRKNAARLIQWIW